MSSVSATQLPALVSDLGLLPMLERYGRVEQVAPRIFRRQIISAVAPPEGDSGVVITGAKRPARMLRGSDAPARTMDQAYQWFRRFHKYGQRMSIPEEMYNSPNGLGLVTRFVTEGLGGWGEGWAQEKEFAASNLFNKGVLSAGDLDTFDGSYPGRPATYPKYIYDGKPLFAATGNNHPIALNSSVTKFNLIASAPLSSTTLETARVAMMSTNAVDEVGDKVPIMPNVLVVPPDLQQTAHVLLESMLKPGTANNDKNWTGDQVIRPIMWRWLTDTTGWFLGEAMEGIEIADSGDALRVDTSAPDPKSGSVEIRGTGYYGHVVTNWRHWFANDLAVS